MDIRTIFLVSSAVIFFAGGAFCYKPNTTLHVHEGENLLYRCNVQQTPDIFVYWTKNDTKSDFRINGTDIAVIDVRRDFSGEYVCHALNTSYPAHNESYANVTIGDVAVEVIKIDVVYPAEIIYMTVTPTAVMENDTFTIACGIWGNPEPTWSLRNRDTGERYVSANLSANVTIGPSKSRCDSAGFWECTGYNRLNKGGNVTMGQRLEVYCSPRAQWGQTFTVETVLGRTETITLNVWGYPLPTYTWAKADGSPVTWGHFDNATGTSTTLYNVQISDLGDYFVRASNEFGVYDATFHVKAHGPPETPTRLIASYLTYDSVTLRWTSGYDMGSQQYFSVLWRSRCQDDFEVKISNVFYDYSDNHGVGQHWTFILTGLETMQGNFIEIAIVSSNLAGFKSNLSSSVTIVPPQKSATEVRNRTPDLLPLTIALGVVAIIALVASLVFFRRWRHAMVGHQNHDHKSYSTFNKS